MTNIFVEVLEIITLQDYKDSSNSKLLNEQDDIIIKYIKQAEIVVKNNTINLNIEDNNVKKAVVLITDCLFEKRNDGAIKREKRGNNSIEFIEQRKVGHRCLNEDIKLLLGQYLNIKNNNTKWFKI